MKREIHTSAGNSCHYCKAWLIELKLKRMRGLDACPGELVSCPLAQGCGGGSIGLFIDLIGGKCDSLTA